MYGASPVETEDWTPADLLHLIEAGRKREQRQAVMLHTHATLCRLAMDGKLPDVWEAFPFWTDEEVWTAKAERIKTAMLRKSR